MVRGGHEIVEAAHGGPALVFAMADPAHGHTHDGPSDHRQIERRVTSHPAAIFSGNDVQPLVQAVFNAPVFAIGIEHLLGVHLRRRTGGHQEFYFRVLGWLAWDLNGPRELGGWFGEGETDAGGADRKSGQATLFGAAAVDLSALRGGSFVLRGKKRATNSKRVVARSWRLRADCL